VTITRWTAEHIAGIAKASLPCAAVITSEQARPILPGYDLWDMWPVQTCSGAVAEIKGGVLWMALCAPGNGNPIDRHLHSRIRLIHQTGEQWNDLGILLPDGLCPGNREWSGSAILDDRGDVTLFFTATGRAGSDGGWQQRLYQTKARLTVEGGSPQFGNWSAPTESVKSDGMIYTVVDQIEGAPGKIKAFRDPGYFRDPVDGAAYLLFSGSLASSDQSHNGCVGIAQASEADLSEWQLLPPLVEADGLNNELERPHIVHWDGLYYLFWSTQSTVFAPGVPEGPTGLYGMVASDIRGPYAPLNGTGLVIANPVEEPHQAFSWLVLDDLRVTSFVDAWGLGGHRIEDDAMARKHFGGTPAPFLKIGLDGDRSALLPLETVTA
jgi:levansucrase